MAGEKTEKPTAKKLQDSRKKGEATSRSPDIAMWAGALVATFVLPMVVRRGFEHSKQLMVAVAVTIETPEVSRCLALLRTAGEAIFSISWPLLAVLFAVGLVVNAAQGGVRPAAALLKPQLKRMNPLTGIKRMVGSQAVWQLTKVLVKTAILGAICWYSVRDILPLLLATGRLPLSETLAAVADTLMTLLRSATAAGLVLAFADYAWVRRKTNKGLRMSKQDIKDEHKRSEGDPMLKHAIRSRQMSMSRNRMMSAVATADVIVVNPVHVAVALKYDASRGAPRVVAKGAGLIAARIRAEGDKHAIPLVEDIPLARALYKACDLGSEIPAEMYAAVARILAFVMALKAKGGAAGFHRPPAFVG